MRCGSHRTVGGQMREGTGGGAFFTPRPQECFLMVQEESFLAVQAEARICLGCGLLWSAVDPQNAIRLINVAGTKELKKRVLDFRTAFPVPAAPPTPPAESLPLPTSPPTPDGSRLPCPVDAPPGPALAALDTPQHEPRTPQPWWKLWGKR